MYAPIVLFVFNRADHFEKTVTALSACFEAKQSVLYIFSDGPKNAENGNKVKEVRQLAHSVRQNNWFRDVIISESQENKGLASSIISGISAVFEQHNKMISLEDDCVVSPYFLTFMNRCLDYYADNHRIGAVAGYAPDLQLPEDYSADIFTAYRSCSCAWASWKDRWNGVDWKLSDVKSLYRDPKLIKRLNYNGSDRFIRLYRQAKGGKDSWSIKFGYHLVKKNMLTVYPRYSYITNIGGDNSGVHSSSDDADKLVMDLSKAIVDPVIEYVELDERIQKLMKKFYSGGLISDVKRAVATKAIILKERIKR